MLFFTRLLVLVGLTAGAALPAHADTFWTATVLQASPPQYSEAAGQTALTQNVRVRDAAGRTETLTHNDFGAPERLRVLAAGDRVVVSTTTENPEPFIGEPYRLPALGWLAGFFVLLAAGVAGLKVLRGLAGLLLSVAAIVFGLVPALLAGSPPLPTTLVALVFLALLTFYTAHGLNRQTTLGLLATLLTLGLATGLGLLAVKMAALTGFGSEGAMFLSLGADITLDLRGLLLAGMLIGTLGLLDDLTLAQIATVNELHAANPGLTSAELLRRALVVGRTHVASMLNTLVLAYAGASLPLFLLFQILPQPLWTTLNSEFLAEEIVRTLVGSCALLAAIPLATWLAARDVHRRRT